jgi:hypothetical protein
VSASKAREGMYGRKYGIGPKRKQVPKLGRKQLGANTLSKWETRIGSFSEKPTKNRK